MALQKKLMAACPSLVFSRVLRKPKDFDLYDSELLRSEALELTPSPPAFERSRLFSRRNRARGERSRLMVWLALVGLCFTGAIALSIHAFSNSIPSNQMLGMISVCILLGLAIFASIGERAVEDVSKAQWNIGRARRWLAKGKPVVFAASDEFPDERIRLPKSVVYFSLPAQPSRSDLQRTA